MSKDEASYHKLVHLFSTLFETSFIQAQLDALPFQSLILDAEGVIIMVNEVWRQSAVTNGYKQPDFGIGVNYVEVCKTSEGDDAALVAQGLRSLISGEQSEFRVKYRCVTPDKNLWYEILGRSFKVEDLLYIMLLHQDITDLVLLDEQHRQTRYLYELLAGNVPGTSIFLFDKSLHYILAEGSNIEQSGMSKSGFIGKTLYDLFPKEIADRDTPILLDALHGITTISEVPYGDMYFEVKTLPVRNNGEIVGGMVFTHDITERKLNEISLREKEKLEVALAKEKELNQLKNRMMSRISHEFRTPLTVIQSSSELLRHYADRLTPERREQQFDKILNEIRQLVTVLDDISFLLRTNSSRFEPVEINLPDLFAEIVNGLTGHTFDTGYSDSLPPVTADYNLLKSIITNLISNAIKYSPENSVVHLHAGHSDTEVIIKVRDEGIGMNEEEYQRIFEPFYRGTNIGDSSGIGLGMSIVREAVELHQGRLEVKSKRGEGTTMIVYLPKNAAG